MILGALAKGYVADKIVDFLKRIGVEAGLINLGGNVLTFGQASHNPDGYWRIGIQDPQKPRGENALVLKNTERIGCHLWYLRKNPNREWKDLSSYFES